MSAVTLSDFQKEKLEYYFRFLCPSEAGYLDPQSITKFMNKVLEFTGWEEDGRLAKECREVHVAFFEVLFEKSKEEATLVSTKNIDMTLDKCSKDIWLAMWSHMLTGAMGISNFPIWLRLMPKYLFKMIDRSDKGYLTADDLAVYYRDMIHLEEDQVRKVADKAYEQMTDGGKWPLTLESYEQLFANFLIGRTPYGPGRYIFGCFEHEVRDFKLIQPAPEPIDKKIKVVPTVIGAGPGRKPIKAN